MGLLSFFGFGTSEANAWDIPVKNFGEVVPGKIYRSAAPDLVSLQAAKEKVGIKTVLDLQNDWSLSKWRGYAWVLHNRLGITALNVPFNDKAYPREIDVTLAMTILTNEENWPILVHCAGGRHRTGGIIAEYRKRYQGWTPEEAYKEAKKYDFYSRWGHRPWKDFILRKV